MRDTIIEFYTTARRTRFLVYGAWSILGFIYIAVNRLVFSRPESTVSIEVAGLLAVMVALSPAIYREFKRFWLLILDRRRIEIEHQIAMHHLFLLRKEAQFLDHRRPKLEDQIAKDYVLLRKEAQFLDRRRTELEDQIAKDYVLLRKDQIESDLGLEIQRMQKIQWILRRVSAVILTFFITLTILVGFFNRFFPLFILPLLVTATLFLIIDHVFRIRNTYDTERLMKDFQKAAMKAKNVEGHVPAHEQG